MSREERGGIETWIERQWERGGGIERERDREWEIGGERNRDKWYRGKER